jgi:transposase
MAAAVMIGVDPHKGSHTAVVIDQAETVLGQVRVRAGAAQAERLMEWAMAWPERTWAVEGAAGMGHLLAQQLLAAGERVLDVQPKLGARVRLLATGATNKNDPNDALSVAIAALRSTACTPVRPDDHAAVLKIWAKRHRDLSRARNQVLCRLHAVLCDLIPGGVSKEITAAGAARALEQAKPSGAVQAARHELAAEFLADLRRIDAQLHQTRKKLATAVRASGTTLTEVFGAGPVIAATVIGDVRDISRFPSRDRFAAYNGTAPAGVSSGNRVIYRLSLRGNRRLNHAIHMAAITQIRYRHSRGRACLRQEAGRRQDQQRSTAGSQTADQRRFLQAPEGRCGPRRQQQPRPGRAPGERLWRQRGRLAPRAPALRPSHSRTCSHPTNPAGSLQGRVPRAAGAGLWPARSSCPQGP